jgi:hypothetical protein
MASESGNGRRRTGLREWEQKRAERQAAAHMRIILRMSEIKLAVDIIRNRLETDGVGDNYPLAQLIADLDEIGDLAARLGDEDRKSSSLKQPVPTGGRAGRKDFIAGENVAGKRVVRETPGLYRMAAL